MAGATSFADVSNLVIDQDGVIELADVDVHDLRNDEQDAVRALILHGLGEHWESVDPALNPDLDDLATTPRRRRSCACQ